MIDWRLKLKMAAEVLTECLEGSPLSRKEADDCNC